MGPFLTPPFEDSLCSWISSYRTCKSFQLPHLSYLFWWNHVCQDDRDEIAPCTFSSVLPLMHLNQGLTLWMNHICFFQPFQDLRGVLLLLPLLLSAWRGGTLLLLGSDGGLFSCWCDELSSSEVSSNGCSFKEVLAVLHDGRTDILSNLSNTPHTWPHWSNLSCYPDHL